MGSNLYLLPFFSCFANVVLQCLSFTRPLVAYLLEKGHRRECNVIAQIIISVISTIPHAYVIIFYSPGTCNDWCFLCEFENHVDRTRLSSQVFSPMNILSRLPNIGGTLGYGRQEDAHEFMRFVFPFNYRFIFCVNYSFLF